MRRIVLSLCSILLTVCLSHLDAQAQEVCGDGVDNDSDGLADNGCWPAGVTGMCESPLSCARGGAVAPKTGLLYYRMPPDLSPKVPKGPGISFQRVYTSGYNPGYTGGAVDYQSPMGYRWQHNWMSWVKLVSGTEGQSGSKVMVHTVLLPEKIDLA